MTTLKQAYYEIHGGRAQVLYYVRGMEIYFTDASGTGTTINKAEDVIASICAAERIKWWDYTFYDVQTSLGYRHGSKDPSYYCVDRLTLYGEHGYDRPENASWQPVATRDHLHVGTHDNSGVPLVGIPDEVREVFRLYMDTIPEDGLQIVNLVLSNGRAFRDAARRLGKGKNYVGSLMHRYWTLEENPDSTLGESFKELYQEVLMHQS